MSKFGFDGAFIDKIKQNNDIVSVISKYIPLNKKGNQFWACCPFHYEKTPSFAVNEQEQFYHCFGCGESGDVISFVQKYENVDFVKAVEILAKNAGLEIPQLTLNENISKHRKLKERVLEVNKEAAKFYVSALHSEKGKEALAYLEKRNISRQSQMKFGLGFSPDWTSLVSYLKQKGFSEKEMVEAGVADTKNGRTYDCFCNRIMFPILDSFSQVVGFSGRTMSKEKNIAKYRNTKETIVFDKSKSIFGINLLKKFKQENPLEKILIAEGQIDVIKIHQAGFSFAVACMGTALTPNHAKVLSRFCDKVVVCFDGDGAGQKAALRSLDIFADEGFNVSVVTMPDGKDPDEFISEFGSEKFKNLIEFAKPVVDFKIHNLSKKYDLKNNFEKSKFVKEALEILKNQPSKIDSEIYLSSLHELTGISTDLLRQDLSIKPIIKKTGLIEKPTSQENGYVVASRFVLASLLHKKDYAKIIEDEFFFFLNSSLEKLYQMIKKGVKIGDLFEAFDVEKEENIKQIIDFSFSEENGEQFYLDSVKHIIKQNVQMSLDKLKEEVKICDNDKKLEIMKKIQKLTKKLIEINGGING